MHAETLQNPSRLKKSLEETQNNRFLIGKAQVNPKKQNITYSQLFVVLETREETEKQKVFQFE